MGNSLRCCLACVLPCGALDVIRIVHLNGCVDEITGPITAGEILDANPNHILSKPSTQGVGVRRILILSPESELKRGSIYFLIPAASVPEKKKSGAAGAAAAVKRSSSSSTNSRRSKTCSTLNNSDTDQYLSDIISEKKSSRRDRRSGRVGVWRPHLESISEDF